MATMSPEVQEVFTKVPDAYFATANADGQPNVNVIGMKKVIDDETLYLSDQFFTKTLANLKENTKVAVIFHEGQNAYQIHGTARYVCEGAEYEEQAAWVNAIFEAKGSPLRAKGGVFVHVDSVFSAAGGPTAGKHLA